ncbi:MAG: hypothetical protein V7784_02395 [Oceanospirillaceae bacterium]
MSPNKASSEYVYGVEKEDFNYLQREREEGLESEGVTSKDHYMLIAIGFIPFAISTLWFITQ